MKGSMKRAIVAKAMGNNDNRFCMVIPEETSN
jgi:hypothetical protein